MILVGLFQISATINGIAFRPKDLAGIDVAKRRCA